MRISDAPSETGAREWREHIGAKKSVTLSSITIWVSAEPEAAGPGPAPWASGPRARRGERRAGCGLGDPLKMSSGLGCSLKTVCTGASTRAGDRVDSLLSQIPKLKSVSVPVRHKLALNRYLSMSTRNDIKYRRPTCVTRSLTRQDDGAVCVCSPMTQKGGELTDLN